MNNKYYSREPEQELHPDMRQAEQEGQWKQAESPKAPKSPLPLIRGLIYATILMLLLAAISYKNIMLLG